MKCLLVGGKCDGGHVEIPELIPELFVLTIFPPVLDHKALTISLSDTTTEKERWKYLPCIINVPGGGKLIFYYHAETMSMGEAIAKLMDGYVGEGTRFRRI